MGTLCYGFTHCLSSASAVVGLYMYHAKKDSAIKRQRTTPDARFKPWIASPVTAISRLFNEPFPKFDHQQWNYNPLTSQFTFFVTLFYTFSAIILHTLYNAILRIAKNFLETKENIKISTHPFYHVNLDWFSWEWSKKKNGHFWKTDILDFFQKNKIFFSSFSWKSV